MCRRGSACVPVRARCSTAAKRASLRCKLGSERRTSPKAQRNFPKLDILPNNIFLNAEQRRIGKTYTRVDVFCGGA